MAGCGIGSATVIAHRSFCSGSLAAGTSAPPRHKYPVPKVSDKCGRSPRRCQRRRLSWPRSCVAPRCAAAGQGRTGCPAPRRCR
ncbi:hypothetical protein I553_7057 [Mycobacterium xenopi 4042]|uniref:Uncharacterized protein n=1 Tax=Mycobacterium xenopi 4042 TaxID=1299334 RepID=X7Z394_MYCXE|nr:hypothetical protein I553_7057 [Mycobacterium xenopi 4042]